MGKYLIGSGLKKNQHNFEENRCNVRIFGERIVTRLASSAYYIALLVMFISKGITYI